MFWFYNVQIYISEEFTEEEKTIQKELWTASEAESFLQWEQTLVKESDKEDKWGKALIGAKKGQVVDVELADGEVMQYRVLKIEKNI